MQNRHTADVRSANPTPRPASYLREGAGVETGIGLAYGVRDF